MYENTKRSQMCNKVRKLLAHESSIQAPIMQGIITDTVKGKLQAMKTKLHTQENKLRQAQAKYNNLIRETHELQVKGQGDSNHPRNFAHSMRNHHHSNNASSPPKMSHPPFTSKPITPAEKKRRRNLRQKENKKRRRAAKVQ